MDEEELTNGKKGKWICFAPLPLKELVHTLYDRVCEKEGQPHLSSDEIEVLLNRGGHGLIRDIFGQECERRDDWIEEINGVHLNLTILNGKVEVSQFEEVHHIHVDDDEIYELKRRCCSNIPKKDALKFIVTSELNKEM